MLIIGLVSYNYMTDRFTIYCQKLVLHKHHTMLPRQIIDIPFQLHSGGFHFLYGLGLGHFVEFPNGYAVVFAPVFDQVEFPIRPKGIFNGGNHGYGIIEFVVDIDHQYLVH